MKVLQNGFAKRLVTILLMAALITSAAVTELRQDFSPASAAAKVLDEPVILEEQKLYAQSAVLMDAATGRVLYSKKGDVFRPNASTTKILTCIIALEQGNLDRVVTVSEYAASMPEVKLHVKAGEAYRLYDLLYSLMLESHNDAAVVIAEAVAGSVEAFSERMNQLAEEIGCKNSFFLTPNGLDQTVEVKAQDGTVTEKSHGTTAEDLARIMSYCILRSTAAEEFLKITRTASYSFCNQVPLEGSEGGYTDGDRSFSCSNHNAYLQMNGDALSGKTGFTAAAGYCYVGALENQGRTFVVALLACGWPNHKNYKWQDCNTLFTYGQTYYHNKSLDSIPVAFEKIPILDDANENFLLSERKMAVPKTDLSMELLLADWEEVKLQLNYTKILWAPVSGRTVIGKAQIFVDEAYLDQRDIYIEETAVQRDYLWYIRAVLRYFCGTVW